MIGLPAYAGAVTTDSTMDAEDTALAGSSGIAVGAESPSEAAEFAVAGCRSRRTGGIRLV